ncbi:MAG: phosphoesterase [Candidatus Thermofonsia Clade 1 bacterium]|uniref:Phosphoesterase n=1 Tax=Candidatus Thermofonsia Clade 1 bacterium TaxID=2364210 RepID=A0A2M8P1T3_9CHLR|nr:MAG: phosphoesterase [Candidatus Thermofonsia Clade 1 bacterium]
MTTWRVELHSHTLYSLDSLTSLESFLRTCEARKLDKVAVTDHNTAEGALKLARMAPERIIVGEEIMTTEGELLAYFVQETVPPFLSPEATIERLRQQGAVISVSHPFDRLRKGAWDEANLRRILPLVDAIEGFNARCLFPADNAKALAFAQAHGKPYTVGSDAHAPYELGRAVLEMMPFTDAESFRRALRVAAARTRLSAFWVHFYSKYAKWARKLGVAKLPDAVLYS